MIANRTINDLRAKMSPDALAKVEERAREVRAEIILSELGKQADDAHAEIAAALGVKHPVTSPATEGMPLATLRKLVHSMGLELEVSIVLPHGRRVSVTPSIAPAIRSDCDPA